MTLKVQVAPTGMVLFGPLPEAPDYYLMWLGEGTRLHLAVKPFSPDGTLVSIEHPTANGIYNTRREAAAAANAFASWEA